MKVCLAAVVLIPWLAAPVSGELALPDPGGDARPAIAVPAPDAIPPAPTPEPPRPEPLKLSLELTDGSRIVGIPSVDALPVKTTFADITTKLDLLSSILFGDDPAKASFLFQNGDKLEGALTTPEINLETAFGRHTIPLKHAVRLDVITGAASALPATLTKALVLHYSFDRDENGKVTDKSGKENHGVVYGAKWVGNGKRGGACKFDGTRDYIETARNLGLKQSAPWTVSVWGFYTAKDSQNVDNFISLGQAAQNRIFAICRGQEPEAILLNLWGPQNHYFKCDFDFAKTYGHIAAAYDGNTVRVYVNGILKTTQGMSLRLIDNPVRIGGRTGGYVGQYFGGILDEVMIFDRALSDKEIESLHNSQK